MSDKKELLELLKELKSYLEFEQNMGLQTVLVDETKEEVIEKPLQSNVRYMEKQPENKNIIRIEDQRGIFESTRELTLEDIREDLGDCTRCKLHSDRTNIVFGEGSAKAKLVFVGEGPGRDEDEQGRPFVGRAGKLLTKIISAMGLERSDVYICNVVKCRPPNNRNPEQDEVAACEPFLLKQIRSIKPKIIVCLGSVATSLLLKMKNVKMAELRGTFHQYGNAKLLVTYHPAALLRNPSFKKPVWDDMKIVMKELGMTVSGD